MAESGGWFSRLTSGLKRSSDKITSGITTVIKRRKLDEATLQDLEDILIQADLGLPTALKCVESLRKTRFNQDISEDEIKQALAEQITPILESVAAPLTINATHTPHVVLVVGVNGSGKTTTIGKLAKTWVDAGLKVRIVAGDTFRAAAVEQLQLWGERIGAPVMVGAPKSDAAGLAYGALETAQANKEDVLIIDTAGRLQNKTDLMDELGKINRVLKKLDAAVPHDCLLVLDAGVGQNAHSQVDTFSKTVPITGLIMTKLDGTARGGVLVSLAEKFKLPIHAIGVGEKAEDLRPFSAADFAHGLVGMPLSK